MRMIFAILARFYSGIIQYCLIFCQLRLWRKITNLVNFYKNKHNNRDCILYGIFPIL